MANQKITLSHLIEEQFKNLSCKKPDKSMY